MKHSFTMTPCGDAGLMIRFEQRIAPDILHSVTQLSSRIAEAQIPGILDRIPAYASILVCYDPSKISYKELESRICMFSDEQEAGKTGIQRKIEIPVLYGKPFPEDLAHVAEHAGISAEEVIRIHTANEYPVYMIGFLPGFPYLGNLDERIHTPRRKTPRTEIPAGAVGIGGAQTGVYPIVSPGGWHILGLTPLRLYDPSADEPVLLRSGDLIRFRSIDEDEFRQIQDTGGRLCL